MKLRFPCILTAALTLGVFVSAAEELKPVAKALGSDFGGAISCTIQYAHEDIWARTASETGVIAVNADELVPGQQLDVVVAFGGATTDRSGNTDVTYDVKITKPDGSESVAGKDLIAHRGRATNPKLVSHPTEMLKLSFSPKDAPGKYRIAATIKDHVAKIEVSVAQEVKLLPDTSAEPLPAIFTDGDFSNWLMHYYLKPEPRLALTILQWISKNKKVSENANAWPAILGQYEMILRDNPWLVPTFMARLANSGTPTDERATLLYVLAYVYREQDNFALNLPESDREYFQLARHQHWPDPSREIVEAGQLDTLWGRFFGTGAYAPIESLVAVLDYHVYHGKLEEFKKLSVKPAHPPVEVYKDVIFGAALWSLKSNAQQHPLVRDYCGTMLRNYKGTDSDIRVLLAMVVGATVHTSDGHDVDLSKPPVGK